LEAVGVAPAVVIVAEADRDQGVLIEPRLDAVERREQEKAAPALLDALRGSVLFQRGPRTARCASGLEGSKPTRCVW